MGDQTQHGEGCHRLSGAAFTHHTQNTVLSQDKINPVDRLYLTVTGIEGGMKVFYSEDLLLFLGLS